MFTPQRAKDMGSVLMIICRGYIRASKSSFTNFSMIDGSMVKLRS